jgi:hypothetical protein
MVAYLGDDGELSPVDPAGQSINQIRSSFGCLLRCGAYLGYYQAAVRIGICLSSIRLIKH